MFTSRRGHEEAWSLGGVFTRRRVHEEAWSRVGVVGRTWNQSIVQQLMREGNLRNRVRKASPIGDIASTM